LAGFQELKDQNPVALLWLGFLDALIGSRINVDQGAIVTSKSWSLLDRHGVWQITAYVRAKTTQIRIKLQFHRHQRNK